MSTIDQRYYHLLADWAESDAVDLGAHDTTDGANDRSQTHALLRRAGYPVHPFAGPGRPEAASVPSTTRERPASK